MKRLYILFNLEWSCLKFPKIEKAVWNSPKMNKAVWSYPKLNEDVPLGPNSNGAIVVWPELILVCWNLPKMFPIYGNIFNFT